MATHAGYVRLDDHFQPDESLDPAAQRRLRGQLDQIDYTAFACNKKVAGRVLGRLPATAFESLATAAATARAQWIAEAMAIAGHAREVQPQYVDRLNTLRRGYEELRDAYEGARRMVERGYLVYEAPPAPAPR